MASVTTLDLRQSLAQNFEYPRRDRLAFCTKYGSIIQEERFKVEIGVQSEVCEQRWGA